MTHITDDGLDTVLDRITSDVRSMFCISLFLIYAYCSEHLELMLSMSADMPLIQKIIWIVVGLYSVH